MPRVDLAPLQQGTITFQCLTDSQVLRHVRQALIPSKGKVHLLPIVTSDLRSRVIFNSCNSCRAMRRLLVALKIAADVDFSGDPSDSW